MLSATEFAKETEISYPVVIRWLKEQADGGEKRLPGAKLVSVGKLTTWQIPADLIERFKDPANRPKVGWKKGVKRSATATEGAAEPPKPAKKASKKGN